MSCLIRIPSLDMGHIAMITDRLIYTDTKNKSVHCCNLQGGEVWKILVNDASPRGIQFDKHEKKKEHDNLLFLRICTLCTGSNYMHYSFNGENESSLYRH
jgi:hypothetical protein